MYFYERYEISDSVLLNEGIEQNEHYLQLIFSRQKCATLSSYVHNGLSDKYTIIYLITKKNLKQIKNHVYETGLHTQ